MKTHHSQNKTKTKSLSNQSIKKKKAKKTDLYQKHKAEDSSLDLSWGKLGKALVLKR